MKNLPASDFLDRYVSAYGESWENTFAMMTEAEPCAKHMAEFIDDVEMYGQQTPVYVDKSGMVSDGHKLAIALFILGEPVEFVNGDPDDAREDQIWSVEFDTDMNKEDPRWDHLMDYLSFRIEDHWVYPIVAAVGGGSVIVDMYCEGGEYTADRMLPVVQERLAAVGIEASGFYVGVSHGVDEEGL